MNPAGFEDALGGAAAGDTGPLARLAARSARALDALAAHTVRAHEDRGVPAEIVCPAGHHPGCVAAASLLDGSATAPSLGRGLWAAAATVLAAVCDNLAAGDGAGGGDDMAGWPAPLRHGHAFPPPGRGFIPSCGTCGMECPWEFRLGCPGCLEAALGAMLAHVLSEHLGPEAAEFAEKLAAGAVARWN